METMFKMLLYIRFRSRALAKFYNARFPAKCGNRFAKKKICDKRSMRKREKISKFVAKLSLIFAFFGFLSQILYSQKNIKFCGNTKENFCESFSSQVTQIQCDCLSD